jgi:HTH-like domain
VRPDAPMLSVRRQCELLMLARSTLYYVPMDVDREEIVLMKEIDRIYTRWPFYGSRRIVLELRKVGHDVNRKRVQRLMQVMGLQALVPGPHTSKPHPEHRIYPYLPATAEYRPIEPGLGHRHHLHPARARLGLLGRHHGLVLPCGPRPAPVEHDDGRLLHRGPGRRLAPSWNTGDLQ